MDSAARNPRPHHSVASSNVDRRDLRPEIHRDYVQAPRARAGGPFPSPVQYSSSINQRKGTAVESLDIGELFLDDEIFPALSPSTVPAVKHEVWAGRNQSHLPRGQSAPRLPDTSQTSIPPSFEPKITTKSGHSRTVDFSALLQPQKPQVKSTQTVALSAVPKASTSKNAFQDPVLKGNALDSSVPTRLRGKEKIAPKKNKPSALKKAILTSRLTGEVVQPESSAPEESVEIVEEATAAPGEGNLPSTPEACAPQISLVKCTKRDRKFYCNHVIPAEIATLSGQILEKLVFYQDRAHHQDPLVYKRRFVCGFKDVGRHIETREIKLIFLASDLERADVPGGITDQLAKIREKAAAFTVPVVFVLKRNILARKCRKSNVVSIVGIYNYDVANAEVKRLLAVEEERVAQSTQPEPASLTESAEFT